LSFSIDFDDSAKTAATIQRGLEAHNNEAVGFEVQAVPLHLAVRDADGKLCGGILALTYTDTLRIETVWLDKALRGHGQGKAMMDKVEAEGRRRGARQAWLVTLSWQARPFYEKLGYHVFGEMPIMDGQHMRYFMRKAL
jgi:ribosomal protein S18 acetylase RimI-like enzyme